MQKISLKNIFTATAAAVMLLAGSAASAHNVSLDGSVEIDGGGYWKLGDGTSVGSGSGCVRSAGLNDDNSIAACEGEGVATAEAPKAPKAPESTAKVETMTVNGMGLFETDSDELTSEGSAKINELMAELKKFKGVLGIEVEGHADSRGSDEYNLALSQRRAETIQAMLAGAYPGVAINAVGKGEAEPVASNESAEGRQANRRVEISVNASRMVFN